MREVQEEHKKTEKSLRETQKVQRQMTESFKEEQKKTEESIRKLTKNINKAHGDFTGKWGRFLEKLVKGDFLNILCERGIDVIRVLSRVPFYRPDRTKAGDIDLMALNGGDVVAVEVKTTLLPENVNHHLEILKKFKGYFPEHQDKKLYGGVAYLDEENKAYFPFNYFQEADFAI